jgi:hypothetical protein
MAAKLATRHEKHRNAMILAAKARAQGVAAGAGPDRKAAVASGVGAYSTPQQIDAAGFFRSRAPPPCLAMHGTSTSSTTDRTS